MQSFLVEAGRPSLDDARRVTGAVFHWQAAYSSGEESVGGTVTTPDQDAVDEIGRALGVEQDARVIRLATCPVLTVRQAKPGARR